LNGGKTFEQLILTDAEFHGVGISNHAPEISASRWKQGDQGISTPKVAERIPSVIREISREGQEERRYRGF
jgi:hypothetical protein